MSYILDALKKSERQRPSGPVPDLFTVQGPQPPPNRRWPASALAVALLSGCVLALGAWSWLAVRGRRERAPPTPISQSATTPAEIVQDVEPVPPAADPVPPRGATGPARTARAVSRPSTRRVSAGATSAAEPRAAAPTSAPAVTSPAASPPFPSAPLSSAANEQPIPAVPAPSPGAAAPVSVESSPTAPVTPAVEIPAVSPTTPPSETPAAADQPAVSPPSVSADVSPAAAPEPAPASAPAPAPASGSTAPSTAPEIPPPDGRVIDFAALPDAVRTELPELGISGHVWSEEPTLRLLTMQDRIVREGGEAAPGVTLEEITQTGAVLSFRGWRFRVNGF